MTIEPIIESSMTFGPYPEGHCLYIEKSKLYDRIKDKVKMAEFLFLRLKDNGFAQIWIVEAKSSTPRPETQPNFDEFIDEIHEKMVNALALSVAAFLKRHSAAAEELSPAFQKLDLSTVEFRFVLVVYGHKNEWLPPLKDALAKSLHATIKTWGLPPASVVALNETLARQHGLILSE